MSKQNNQLIQIWFYEQVPQYLRHLCCNCEWVALIPPDLAVHELEMLFIRSHTDRRPIIRHMLDDGSIMFARKSDDD